MKKCFGPHIGVIREAIEAIVRYRPDDQAHFLSNSMLQDAVLMRLHVIGEHLARMRQIDEERFAREADSSWFQPIGLRNIISHGYETIDQERIWQMICAELPQWIASLDALEDR